MQIKMEFTVCLLFAAIIAGCTTPKNIEIRDPNAFSQSLRASYNLLPSDAKNETFLFDVDVSYVRGKSSQTFTVEDSIVLRDSTFNGPVTIAESYNMLNAMIGVSKGLLIKDIFAAELQAGVDLMNTNVKIQSGAKSQNKTMFNQGMYFAEKLSFRPVKRVKIYARHINGFDLGHYGWTSDELGLAVNLHRNIALFADWRWFGLIYHNSANESNIRINANGPMAGLELNF